MQRVPMTTQGVEKIKEELTYLKNKRRPEITQAIAEARAHGDLKENAEYHAAREQQGFVEARIRDIEHKLGHVQVIDVTTVQANGRVVFGATVHMVEITTEENIRYQIVGDDEADIKAQKISVNAPIARALIGKYEGDEVEVNTPKGIFVYEIAKIEYV